MILYALMCHDWPHMGIARTVVTWIQSSGTHQLSTTTMHMSPSSLFFSSNWISVCQYVESVLAPHANILIPKIGMRITALLRECVLRNCDNGTSRGACSAAARTGEARHATLANLSATLFHAWPLYTFHCSVGIVQYVMCRQEELRNHKCHKCMGRECREMYS